MKGKYKIAKTKRIVKESAVPQHKNEDQLRRDWQFLKSLNQGNFWWQWNSAHTQAYVLAEKHYQEAMECFLDAPMRKKIIDKATEIRELWDNIDEITPMAMETHDIKYKKS